MNKIILISICIMITTINNYSNTTTTSYMKCKSSREAQYTIDSTEALLNALNLLIKHKHKGYLMENKEKKIIYLCLWDKPFGLPKSIHPFYKEKIEIMETNTKHSENIFSIEREDLQKIRSYLEKGPIVHYSN